MCFSEFIGYTCGHMSLPVLRPCPMTTERHSNPICAIHAQRPFLADEMCGPCQRLLHSRAVLIEESEHRFMHERGACGCDVVFPHLIRPRAIGPASLYAEDEDFEEVEGNQKSTEIPPIYQNVEVGSYRQILVRLPSLYGAEWLSDHRKEHDAGRCQCQVDFGTYRSAMTGTAEPTTLSLRQPRPQRPNLLDRVGLVDHVRGLSFHDFDHGQASDSRGPSPLTPPAPSSEPKQVTRSRFLFAQSRPQVQDLVDQTKARPRVEARIAGAIYQAPPPFVGRAGSYLTTTSAALDRERDQPSLVVDAQTCVYKPQGLPLVGLPIGAGPEGTEPHVGPWEDCALNHQHSKSA